MLVEGNAIEPRAAGSEALKVALAGTSPIPELCAELEGGARGRHPVPRIERQQAAELLERRQSAHGLIAAGRIADSISRISARSRASARASTAAVIHRRDRHRSPVNVADRARGSNTT